MKTDSYLLRILDHFKSLDIDLLRRDLKENYSYQDTTKEIFLNELEEIFEAHKNSGDSELIIYKGKCAGTTCENCGKKGYRFVGNHSKNYLDLLFEMKGADITDICQCHQFESFEAIEGLSSHAVITINFDERVTFPKTPEYWAKLSRATEAYAEIITTPPQQVNFEAVCYWLDKHYFTNEWIGKYNIFNPSFKWTPFLLLYNELENIRVFIDKNLSQIKKATGSKNGIVDEQELIYWLLKYENTYAEMPCDLMYSFEKVEGGYLLSRKDTLILTGDKFTEILDFLEFHQKEYDHLMDKYNTYTSEEETEAFNYKEVQSNSIDVLSLRFHLDKRKALEEIGIRIPLFLTQVSKEINQQNDCI